jgi:eukaryotic translation initiation factor 2C
LLTLTSNDFFLQSHVGIKGTAKPTHYFVLQDDMKFSAQQLQDFIHSLCFTYARSTCSVSYATPAYYADRLCDRVRHYYADWLSGKVPVRQPNKNENVTREHIGWQDFKKAWHRASVTGERNPWNKNLDDKMFWL